MAVLGPFEVGSGLLNFLSPNYTPVAGRAGPADWTFGGGGNYIRPWTSFSQRLVEANNSLGPFAMRLGGNITGRLVISTQSESLGQLAYCDQPWYTVNDGNTGYPSKAEWWGTVVKTVVQARDLNTAGHPMIHVEVAYFDPTDPAERYNPSGIWDVLSGISGFQIPNVLGWLTGSPSNLPPNHDPVNHEPPFTFWNDVANWVSNQVNNYASDYETAYQNTTGQQLVNFIAFAGNVLQGIEAGAEGVNHHIAHNITPPDENGSFDSIPGETKENPRDLILRDGLQQLYAKSFGSAALLDLNPSGSDSNANSQNLYNALVSAGIEYLGTPNLGIGNQGAGTVAFYIHGRTVYTEAYATANGYPTTNAAPNPTIDSEGNLRIYDTYEFQNSRFDPLGNWVSNNINQAAGQELNAFFDTFPGFHTYDALNSAGLLREQNEGGTGGASNISSLQNTYTAVVISPQNLKQGNPVAYQQLLDSGYYSHVDPSNLP